jgi:hypothetical protein
VTAPTRDTLSADEARRITLRAQGFLGVPRAGRGAAAVRSVHRRLGAVQLDTISVLARSHQLVPYARLGPVGRPAVEAALWDGGAVEYWSHAACVIPAADWPLYAFRRRHFAERGMRWHDRPADSVFADVRAVLAAEGPITTKELGGAKTAGEWWSWGPRKIAIEFMLDLGEVVCTRRAGWRRVYDLPERALATEVRAADTLDDAACFRGLVALGGAALGVATVADLADYPRISREAVTAALPASGLVPVRVAGWRDPAWADPAALAALDTRGRHRTTLLSPFDSLIWDRARTRRVFGFTHALEAYKPAAKRDYGYFAMPLLAGGRLIGRADPKRDGRVLTPPAVFLDSRRAVGPMAVALREAAAWVGCDEIRLARVEPPESAAALAAALAAI